MSVVTESEDCMEEMEEPISRKRTRSTRTFFEEERLFELFDPRIESSDESEEEEENISFFVHSLNNTKVLNHDETTLVKDHAPFVLPRKIILCPDEGESWDESKWFFQLVTPSFLEIIERGTESYRESKFPEVPVVERKEILTWIGINLLSGICRLPELNMYWDENWGVEMVKNSCLSRARYYEISRVFHLEEDQEQDPKPSSKFKKMENLLKKRYQGCLNPSQQISLDEAMVHFEGRSSLKVLMPNKPVPEGFKFYCVCEAKTGYLLNLDLSETSISMDELCGKLLEPFFGKGYHLYMDNFFCTVRVFENLVHNQIYCTGTFRFKRLPSPLKNIWTKKIISKWERGKSEWSVFQHILFSALKDNNAFVVGSTVPSSQTFTKISRKTQTGENLILEVPEIVSSYVQFLRGVDILDQRRSYYSAEDRKNKKWWKKIFLFLLDTAIINSWILSQSNSRQLNFRMNLIKKFIFTVLSPKHGLTTSHFLSYTENVNGRKKRRNCKLCYQVLGKILKVTQECKKCGAAFHLECFRLWHTISDVSSITPEMIILE